MTVGKKVKDTETVDLRKLAKAVNKSADDAGSELPAEQRAAYRAARDSVVKARRSAENIEGQLRIG
jgi:hypothetical protein